MDEEKLRRIIQRMIDNNEPDEKIREVVKRAKEMMASTESPTVKAESDANDNVATGAEIMEETGGEVNRSVRENRLYEVDGKMFNVSGVDIGYFLRKNPKAVDISNSPYDWNSPNVDQSYNYHKNDVKEDEPEEITEEKAPLERAEFSVDEEAIESSRQIGVMGTSMDPVVEAEQENFNVARERREAWEVNRMSEGLSIEPNFIEEVNEEFEAWKAAGNGNVNSRDINGEYVWDGQGPDPRAIDEMLFAKSKKAEEDKNIKELFPNASEEALDLYKRGFIDKDEVENFDPDRSHLPYNVLEASYESGQYQLYDPLRRWQKKTDVVNPLLTDFIKSESTINEVRQEYFDYESTVWENNDIEAIAKQKRRQYQKDGKIVVGVGRVGYGVYALPGTITEEEIIKEAKEDINRNVEKTTSLYVNEDFRLLKIKFNKYQELLEKKGADDPETKNAALTYRIAWEATVGEGQGKKVGSMLFDPETEKFLNDYSKKNLPESEENNNILQDAKNGKSDIDILKEDRNKLFYEIVALNDAITNGPLASRMIDFMSSEDASKLKNLGQLTVEMQRKKYEEGIDGSKRVKWNPNEAGRKLSLTENFKRMSDPGKPGERLPYYLSGLPEFGDDFTKMYNDKLAKFLTLTKAIEYNYDPASVERLDWRNPARWVDAMGEATLDRMIGGTGVETSNKIAKRFEGVMEDLSRNVPENLKDRAEDKAIDQIWGGMPEFMFMVGVVALAKRPVAGFGARLFGGEATAMGRAFTKVALESSKARGAQAAAQAVSISESKFLSWGAETMANVGVEVGAMKIFNEVDKTTGGEGMPMSIAAGFGFMNPQMKYLMNTKILAPIMKGEAKGLIPLKPLMRRVVHSAGATATATAVELFDAAVVQGNLDAETYKHITDWEKAGILFTQMLLSGYGSHVMNAPAEIRKFYGKLENELGGHIGSEGAKKVAKKYNIRLGWWTNEMLEKKYNEAKNEIYEDPKYEGQFDPKNKAPFIGADGKPTELSKKLKELDNDFLTLSKLKEQQALQEIIKQNKDSKNTYNEYQRKAAEVINVISKQSETGELQLTQEQIDFIAKCPDGILKLVARGDVIGEETGMIDSQIDRIKNEYSILSHSADYSGFKRGTKQRKEFFDLAQEQESLIAKISKINKNKQQASRAMELHGAKIRIKQIEERRLELVEENQEFLEQRRQEEIIRAQEILAKEYNKNPEDFVITENHEQLKEEYLKDTGVELKGTPEGIYEHSNGKIYIDLQKARDVNNISVAMHEALHKLMEPVIRDPKVDKWLEDNKHKNSEKATKEEQQEYRDKLKEQDDHIEKIVDEFRKELSWEQLREVQLKLMSQGLDPLKYNNVEWFNAFNDAIIDGRIKFENNSNLFKKLANVFVKKTPFINAEVPTGKQAYDFIKDFATKEVKKKVHVDKTETSTEKTPKDVTKGVEELTKDAVKDEQLSDGVRTKGGVKSREKVEADQLEGKVKLYEATSEAYIKSGGEDVKVKGESQPKVKEVKEVTFEDIRDGKVYNKEGENSPKNAKTALTKGVVDAKGNGYKIGGKKGKQNLQKKSKDGKWKLLTEETFPNQQAAYNWFLKNVTKTDVTGKKVKLKDKPKSPLSNKKEFNKNFKSKEDKIRELNRIRENALEYVSQFQTKSLKEKHAEDISDANKQSSDAKKLIRELKKKEKVATKVERKSATIDDLASEYLEDWHVDVKRGLTGADIVASKIIGDDISDKGMIKGLIINTVNGVMKAKGGASISEDVMDAMVDDVKAQLLPHIRNFNREFLAVNERTYDEITTDYENIILNKFLGKTKKNPSSYISKEEKARIKGNWVETILKKNKLTYEEAIQNEIKNLSAEDKKLFDIIKKLEIVESVSEYGTKQMEFDTKDLLDIEGTIPQEVYDKLYDYKVVENESLSAWINSVVKFKTFKAFENQTGEFEFNQDVSDITKNVPRSEEGFFNDFTYEDQYKFVAEKDKFNEESLREKLNISDKLKEDIRQSVLKDMKMKLLGDELKGESTAFTNINIKKASEALREIERLESGVEVIEGVTIKKLNERAKLIGFQVKIFNEEIKEFKQSIQKKFETSYLDFVRKEMFGAIEMFDAEGQFKGLSIKKNIGAYEKFLNDNFKAIYDKLSITTLNEKYKKDKKGEVQEFEFVEKLSEKMTTHESIKQKVMNIHAGNAGWRKLELSELTEIRDGEEVLKQEVLDYFLKPKRKSKNVLNERARGLANVISTELAFDAAMEVFRSKDFQDLISERPEGVVGNEIDIVSKALLRDPNLRFMNTVNEVLGYPVEAFEGIAMESFGDVFDRNLKLAETLDVVLNEIVENRYSYDEAKQKIKDDHQGVVEYLNDYNSGIFEGPDNIGLSGKINTILKRINPETAQGKLLASAAISHNPKEAAELIEGFISDLTSYTPEGLIRAMENSAKMNKNREIGEKGVTQNALDSFFGFSSSSRYGLDRRAARLVSKSNDPKVVKHRANVGVNRNNIYKNTKNLLFGSKKVKEKNKGAKVFDVLLKEKLINKTQRDKLQLLLDKASNTIEGYLDMEGIYLSEYIETGNMDWATSAKEVEKAWNNLDKEINKIVGEPIPVNEKGAAIRPTSSEYKSWAAKNKNTVFGKMELNKSKWFPGGPNSKAKYIKAQTKVKGETSISSIVENYKNLLSNFKKYAEAYKVAQTKMIEEGKTVPGKYYNLRKGFYESKFGSKVKDRDFDYVNDVKTYDTWTGIGRIINTIRSKNIPVEQRRKELDKLTADILKANSANKKLLTDILNSHYELLFKSKKADFEKNWLGWVELMRAQTNLQAGLKSLSSLDFMEIPKDIKKAYNEHVMPFSNTTSRLLEVFSKGLTENLSWKGIEKSIQDIVNDNSSAFVSSKTGRVIMDSRFGRTSDIGSLRLYAVEGLKDLYVVGSKAKNETQRKKEIQEYVIAETYKRGIVKKEAQAAKKNVKEVNKNNVVKIRESATNEEVLSLAATMDAALDIARNPNSPVKKIRVFDFDDTLAKTKSNVLYTTPDGTKGKLTAEEFAKKGSKMVAEGAVLDFSEFNKVVDGKKGPLFEIAEAIQNKRGAKDIFILTARSPEAAKAIHEFLNNAGLNIPLENITGLGDSSPFAKSKWVLEKAAEGYNDFYFADDHAKNVEAVQDALNQINGIKSKTELAKPKNEGRRFSMETKMDLEWKKTEKPGPEWEKEPSIGYKAEFNIKDNKFTISMGKMFESESLAQVNHISGRDDITELKGDYYVLDFAFIDAEGKPRVDETGIMGPDGGKVLSIVANGVLDFVRKNKNIKGLYFSSAIDKRTRIYKAMARTFGNELDWGYKSKKEDALWGETDLIVSADIPVRKNLSGQRKPVRDVLGVIDKSSNTQQARFSETIDLNKIMNQMIEDKTGIPAEKTFDQLAKSIGRKKGRGKIFMPYSTEDFKGLIYPLISSGKVGDAQLKLMNEVLFKPFNRAMNNVSRDRMQINADFKELKRNLKSVPKNLTKEAIPESGLTYENVVRLYLWDKQGVEIEGVNAETMKNVWEIMQEKPELQAFADQLMNINKGDGYYYPGELWLTGNMTSDLYSGINKVKRKKYLAEWKRNKDIMFSKDNMLKLEAAYGPKYVESLRDILRRMETGVNRPEKSSRFEDMAMNYINGSVGVTMFFNTRSAILQTISTANYINWSDNNLYNVGKAYANAPQFAKDFLYLMKSDFMKDRRSGLKINVSESEIADAAKKKGYRGVLNLLLQSGFSLTKAGDAFAIAFGGAPFYRNRVKTYEKQGFDKAEAEKKAFEDFRELTEESQQSARTDKISMQQADKWGRIILAFANTPMQYNRLIKRSAQDLIKGRGDWKSHTSRIVYYLGVQNLIFNALQRALFAMEGDLDSDENKDRYYEVGNGMLDSILRGSGYGGALISVLKNFGREYHEQSKEDRPQYRDAWIELLGIAPPVQAKIKRLQQAGKTLDYNQRTAEEMGWKFSLDNPNYQSVASYISGATNIPLDRLMRKADNVSQVLNDDWENWQKVMMVLGWNKWELETADQKEKMEEEKAKTTKRRRKETYEKNKAKKKREKSKANAAMGLITN